MIVCWRTVVVPEPERERFLAWILENRSVREQQASVANWSWRPPIVKAGRWS